MIIDVILILCSCISTSVLSIFLVRDSDDYASLTPHLTVDRSITICKREGYSDAHGNGTSGDVKVAYATALHTMCALGEVYDVSQFQCRIEYLPHDSFNPTLIRRDFSSLSDLRQHACGQRLQALAMHTSASHASALQYTLIRSDAMLMSSVDAVMLQRLSNSLLRTSMIQKRVHWCVQEQSLGPIVLRQNMLNARVPNLIRKPALQAMADLSVRGCPSVAHVGVGMRGDGYAAVLQYRPLPTAEQVRRVHEALQLPFDESAYSNALAILATNNSYDPAQFANSAHEFVHRHLSPGIPGIPGIPINRIVVGEGNAGSALHAYVQHTPQSDFHVLLEALNTVCVFSVGAGGYAHTWDVGLVESLRNSNRNGGMHRARRQDLDVQMRFDPPTADELVAATAPNVFSVVDEQVHDCVHTVRHFFPNAYEAFVFQTLVPSTLHDRIRVLFARLQHEMQAVLQYSTIRSLFQNHIGPVQELVQRATLRLVGDTTATTTSSMAITSYNTVAAMLEQARQSTSERLRRVHDQSDPCSMAPLFGGVTTNAYFLYPFGCIVVGSGVLLRPFADESYSDTALLMGIGFVLAHELGHALLAGTVDQQLQSQLFAGYPTSTYEEGIADLLGALAVLRIHGSREDMCVRLQQVWCVYVDERVALDPQPSHPHPHTRWADLCALLHREF